MMKIRRAKKLLVSRVDRLWRRYFCEDLEYYYVTYRTRGGRREYKEGRVLISANNSSCGAEGGYGKEGIRGAWVGRVCCQLESLVPISIRAYRLVRWRIYD
jgi:hypothetical protein